MFEKIEAAVLQVVAALVSIAASLKEIAEALKGAKVTSANVAPAPAPAATAAPAPAPAPKAEEDDLGLGPETPKVTYTKDDCIKLAKEVAGKKGRPAVKDILKKLKADTVPDVKPEDIQSFGEQLAHAMATLPDKPADK